MQMFGFNVRFISGYFFCCICDVKCELTPAVSVCTIEVLDKLKLCSNCLLMVASDVVL